MTTIPENPFIKPFAESHRALFVQILTTTQTMHGWATAEKCCTLAALVLALKPKLSVEIGVWGGRSLLPLALAHKAIGAGKVIGIDAWNATESAKDEFPDSATWWQNQDHEMIYKYAQQVLKMSHVEQFVELVRARSDDVTPPADIGVLHIDGSHMEQAVKDTERFCPKVVPGGYVVFDDLTWVGGAVLRSIDTAEQMGFKEIFRLVNPTGDCWGIWQKQ